MGAKDRAVLSVVRSISVSRLSDLRLCIRRSVIPVDDHSCCFLCYAMYVVRLLFSFQECRCMNVLVQLRSGPDGSKKLSTFDRCSSVLQL